jgi:tetratricopeptide (TPR) repeat protein
LSPHSGIKKNGDHTLFVKQQLLLTAGGLLLLIAMLFGKIETQKSTPPHSESGITAFNINDLVKRSKLKLPESQLSYVANLENQVSRGDVKGQTIKQYQLLAAFWKDSAKIFEPYAYYMAESAKLENSEKSLTFAARLMLDKLRGEPDNSLKTWEAESAIDLFQRALQLNPENEDLKVGLGSCYVYGKGMIGDATETMKGIQQLLQVVKQDSSNMKAQMVLGIGGVVSRQYEKAIERLKKVVKAEPGNLEAVSWLADAYAATGDKVNATRWYEYSKKLVNNIEYDKEVDERIKALNDNQ